MARRKFSTHGPYLYNKLYQINIKGQGIQFFQFFAVPIGNAKCYREIEFHPRATVIKYHQDSSNRCCLSSLESYFNSIGKQKAETDLANFIEE